MIQETSVRRKEEDELLRFAHVERTVQKYYALQYTGYADEIPYFFTRKLVDRSITKSNKFLEELHFEIDRDHITTCRKDDWIVVREDGKTEILEDQTYRVRFMKLDDLKYEN